MYITIPKTAPKIVPTVPIMDPCNIGKYSLFMRFDKIIPHWYDVQKNLFVEVIRNFITRPEKYQPVNA